MEKKNNILKIFIILLCLSGVMLFALVAAGVNVPAIEAYKINFKHNISGMANMLGIDLPIEMQLYLDDESAPQPKPTMMPASEAEAMEAVLEYQTEDGETPPAGSAVLTVHETEDLPKKNDKTVALDGAANAKFAELDGKILCVNETRYRAFDQKGELLWEIPIQMQSPQLTVKGEYALINETGAKKVKLYRGKKEVFSQSTEGNIITCDLSENGDVVAVTEKEYFKGQVVVFNKNGKIIFAWNSGSYNILDAAISADRDVAISFLKTDVGADSFVTCFDVDGKEKFKTYDFSNAVIFDLDYHDGKLCGISDTSCIGFSEKGKTLWEHYFGEKTLKSYAISEKGTKVFLFENAGVGELTAISSSGKIYEPIKTESMPDVISVNGNYVAYNSGRDAIVCSISGKKMRRTSCDSDIKGITLLSPGKVFCAYSSSIQTKSTEKVQKVDKTDVTEEMGE